MEGIQLQPGECAGVIHLILQQVILTQLMVRASEVLQVQLLGSHQILLIMSGPMLQIVKGLLMEIR